MAVAEIKVGADHDDEAAEQGAPFGIECVEVRGGEIANSMYFIAGGEVEMELKDRRLRLGVGHFFGEMAALRQARRSATVTAVTRTRLLALDAQDLHALMEREPRVAERVHHVMRQRLARDTVSPKGDIVVEEIEQAGGDSPNKSE